MSVSRRSFLAAMSVGGAAVNLATAAETDTRTGMPTRLFGRTGGRISVLGFGCGSRFLAYGTEERAVAALNQALDLGITYVDTANDYGSGKSETWVGQVMKQRRKQVWLTTKVAARQADQAERNIEAALKRLQTDHVDLIHIHALMGADDLARIEAPDGVLKTMYKMRDQKVCRAIGVTCHADPGVLKTALERHDFDCTQMALNAARVGNVFGAAADHYTPGSFEELALPVALRKNMGITAMKIFAQERLNGQAPVEKLIGYSLSLPVAAAVVGMPEVGHLQENVRVAQGFRPLSRQEMNGLHQQMKPLKASIDRFFADHIDC